MKKRITKLMSTLLCCVMLLGLFPTAAFAGAIRGGDQPAEYGVTYSYDNSVPAEVMATLPTNSYTYSVGQKVTTAAKPEDVTVGDYVWKFQTWQLNGVDVEMCIRDRYSVK